MALRDARGRLVIGGGDPNPVVSIAITTEPTNTQYAGNPLDLTGLVITATRRDGTTEVVTNKAICNREVWGSAVETVVTFGYHEKPAYWTVTPEAVVPVSATIKTAPTKTAYKYGETIDLTGAVLEVTYNDGHKADISEGLEASPETMGSDTEAVTISYTEGEVTVSATQAVTLVEPETLTIKTPATKTAYTDGEDVDTTGLELTVTYSDESTKDITSGFVVSPTVVATGDTEVTVSYTEGAVTINTGYAITVGD